MIYHRVKYNGKHINKSDFRLGFGIDLELLSKIHKARITHNKNNSDRLPTRDDFEELYDKRSGYYIDGTKIETKYHHYHDKSLLNTQTGKIYSIDTVKIENYWGRYMTLGLREIGSKSHKHIVFLNYTCNDPDIIERSINNLGKYKFIDKIFDPVE